MKKRFANLDETDLEELMENKDDKKTQRAVANAKKVYLVSCDGYVFTKAIVKNGVAVA